MCSVLFLNNVLDNIVFAWQNPAFILTLDLIKYGLIPEFVGRLPVLANVSHLSKEDLVRILTEPRNSLMKQYDGLFKMNQVSSLAQNCTNGLFFKLTSTKYRKANNSTFGLSGGDQVYWKRIADNCRTGNWKANWCKRIAKNNGMRIITS